MTTDVSYLTGQLLIAMPGMSDSRFAQTVIYICAHSEDGAMGLVINKLMDSIDFPELLVQVGVEDEEISHTLPIYCGGPVEPARGFVLHSSDYDHEGTMDVDGQVGMTASVDVLREIARGSGPKECLLALGYSGWGPGQLEAEMQQNGWLHASADESILFSTEIDEKWQAAIRLIGIDPNMLSTDAGRA
jgi:putative transcriptional regulator